jgi:hypothetical protein
MTESSSCSKEAAGRRKSQGECKANMLRSLGYGATARVSGERDDARRTKPIEALALDAESSRGAGQLHRTPSKLPAARRNATTAANDAATRDAVENFVALARMTEAKSV